MVFLALGLCRRFVVDSFLLCLKIVDFCFVSQLEPFALALSRVFRKCGRGLDQSIDARDLRLIFDSLLLLPTDHPCRGALLRLFVSLVFSLGDKVDAVQAVFVDLLTGIRVTSTFLVKKIGFDDIVAHLLVFFQPAAPIVYPTRDPVCAGQWKLTCLWTVFGIWSCAIAGVVCGGSVVGWSFGTLGRHGSWLVA
jgi:hypothetical protein